MSETQRTLFNKRACGLLIAGALVLLSIVGVVRVPSPLPPIPNASAVKEIPIFRHLLPYPIVTAEC